MRFLTLVLIVASSFILAAGQGPETRSGTDKVAKTPAKIRPEMLRDIPFPAGVDLQYIIKELARDLDLNVLFDPDSFRTPGRKTYIDLKNVTAAAALDYILLQEKLFFEEAGPKTIIVAAQAKRTYLPQIGVGVLLMSEQLAQYFGVDGGMLINTVRDVSPASIAGLRAGDVIVEVDGVLVRGPLGFFDAVNGKTDGNVVLTIVRDRKRQTVNIAPGDGKSVRSVLPGGG